MRRTLVLGAMLLVVSACKPDLPELETSGKYVRWGAVPSRAVACEGLAARADAYIERAHLALGLALPDGVIAHYYYDPDLTLIDDCDDKSGCTVSADERANRNGDVAEIYATQPLMFHELGHAIHLANFDIPRNALLAESFAELLESGDGEDSWRIDAGLGAPLDQLLDGDDFEPGEALLAADATYTRHGGPMFAEFFADAAGLSSAEDIEAAHEAVTGETWSEAVAAYGNDGCDTQFAQCSGPVLAPVAGAWELQPTVDCEDPDGAIGPMTPDEVPTVEFRRTVNLPEDGDYRIQKEAGIEVWLLPCDVPCGNARLERIAFPKDTEVVKNLDGGPWEMVVWFPEDAVGGPITLTQL